MEDIIINSPESEFTKDILFYRQIAFAMFNQRDLYDHRLCITKNQLQFLYSFIENVCSHPMNPEDLMLADRYCESISGSPFSVAPNELLLNDEYIAKSYASLMALRHRLNPDLETHPSISEIFELIISESKKLQNNPFPYSELDSFYSADDNDVLPCLASACKPITVKNGVCIGQKLSAQKYNHSTSTAVIYSEDGDTTIFSELLSSYDLISSSAVAEVCPIKEVFPKLLLRYDDFTIDTLTLPTPKTERYANRPYVGNELRYAELCDAFFENETFGDRVILIHGKKRAVSAISSLAKKMGLSSFSGISVTKKKFGKKTEPPTSVRIRSQLFRFLAELSDNIKIVIPDHNTDNCSAHEIIPTADVIFSEDNDLFVSSKASVSTSPLPFHSGFYSIAATSASAMATRKFQSLGQLSVSINADLCFEDAESAGRSLATLLGIYDAVTRLSIPIENSRIGFTDKDSICLTVTAHDFSERREGIKPAIAKAHLSASDKCAILLPESINSLDFLIGKCSNFNENSSNFTE